MSTYVFPIKYSDRLSSRERLEALEDMDLVELYTDSERSFFDITSERELADAEPYSYSLGTTEEFDMAVSIDILKNRGRKDLVEMLLGPPKPVKTYSLTAHIPIYFC